MNSPCLSFEKRTRVTLLVGLTLLSLPTIVLGQIIVPPGPIFSTKAAVILPTPATLPWMITQPGAYVLGRNLIAPPGYAGNGIVIDANDVTIDLAGFLVQGVPSSQDGITVLGAQENISIFNGTVTRWGQDGVDFSNATNSNLERLRVADNVGNGISTGAQNTVVRCQAESNGIVGISLGESNVLADCTAKQNSCAGLPPGTAAGITAQANTTLRHSTSQGNHPGCGGIATFGPCAIQDCTAVDNGADGILIGVGGVATGCTAARNNGNGFLADQLVTITDCTATDNVSEGFLVAGGLSTLNHCTAGYNQQNGISVGRRSTVSACSGVENSLSGIVASDGGTINGCTASGNGAAGITAQDGSNIEYCTASGNAQAAVKATANCRVAGNSCENLNMPPLFPPPPGSVGIHLTGSGNRAEGNTVRGHAKGLKIDSSGNDLASNTVSNNVDNYDIVSGNKLDLLLSEIPESIDWPANVTLAGSLTGLSGANGISINADNVTIDLAGHALIGVPGSLKGISSGLAPRNNNSVRNGVVRSWGGDGVDLWETSNGSLEWLRVQSNGADGLRLRTGRVSQCGARQNGEDGIETQQALVVDSTTETNAGRGIVAGNGSNITQCLATSNASHGFEIGGGCALTESTSTYNGGNGIQAAGFGCSITKCAASFNTGNGIQTGGEGTVENCTAAQNGGDGILAFYRVTIANCSANLNTGDGIDFFGKCIVIGNTCGQNGFGGTGAGIHQSFSGAGGDNRIEGNNVTDNDFGIDVDEAGNLIIRNSASGNASGNYSIAPGNAVGPTVTAATIGANTSPHANYDF